MVPARAHPRALTDIGQLHNARMTLQALGRGGDELLLEVDRERGSLLRVEALRGGQPFRISEAVRIEFDEPIPPEKFVFEPPEGVPVEPMSVLHGRHNISIAEAIDAAPFPVYVLDRVPAEWSLMVNFQPGRERMRMKPTVTLLYRSGDAAADLAVSESAAGDELELHHFPPPAPEWEDIERGGIAMKVLRSAPQWPHTTVALIRDGTQVTLTSHRLSTEAMLEAATRLVPARRPD
jgi:hypothetical protein